MPPIPSAKPTLAEIDVSSLTGQLVHGKYRLFERIGEGGMACVYRGQHIALNKEVAVKILKPQRDEQIRIRFLSEGKNASAIHLREPGRQHIVNVTDTGTGTVETPSGKTLEVDYLVMDFMKGVTLKQHIEVHGKLPFDAAWKLLNPVFDAVVLLHRHDVIHRDLKPANIVLAEPHLTPVVIDFGIAKAPDATGLTTETAWLGTSGYTPPEPSAEADGRSDEFSLGVILFECLAGERPFPASDWNGYVAQVHSASALPRFPDGTVAPRGLAQVLARMLKAKPEDRYGSVAEARDEIAAVIGNGEMESGAGASETRTAVVHDVARARVPAAGWNRRRAAGLALAGLSIVAAWSWHATFGSPQSSAGPSQAVDEPVVQGPPDSSAKGDAEKTRPPAAAKADVEKPSPPVVAEADVEKPSPPATPQPATHAGAGRRALSKRKLRDERRDALDEAIDQLEQQ